MMKGTASRLYLFHEQNTYQTGFYVWRTDEPRWYVFYLLVFILWCYPKEAKVYFSFCTATAICSSWVCVNWLFGELSVT